MIRPEDQRLKNNARTRARRELLKASGLCSSCGRAPRTSTAYCDPCRKRHNRYMKSRQQEFKDRVFDILGRECVCCGENNIIFLTVDHVHNDGCVEGRQRSGPYAYYKELKLSLEEGKQDKYQTLCYNCNCGRYRNGGICPHAEG